MATLEQWKQGEVSDTEMLSAIFHDFAEVLVHLRDRERVSAWYRLQEFKRPIGSDDASWRYVQPSPAVKMMAEDVERLNAFMHDKRLRFHTEIPPVKAEEPANEN